MSLNKMLFQINSSAGGAKDEDDDDSDEEDKELESTTTRGIVFPSITKDDEEEEENDRVVPESWEDDIIEANYKSNQAVPAVLITLNEPEVPEYHDQFYWRQFSYVPETANISDLLLDYE